MAETETTEPEDVMVVEMVDPDLTIHERLASIVAEMPAIGKTQRNEQQKFMYRGHDDVMNALNPLLSKYGVFFTPRVLERLSDQRATKSGGVMYEVDLHVEYTFYGPKGDSLTASAWGEGTDSGDKSTNKAMTMALKNVLAQVFAVSTEEQSLLDTDQHTDEETTGRRSQGARPTTVPVGKLTDWKDPRFDPANSLAKGAPAGWEAITALVLELDSILADWIAQAVLVKYGSTVKEITDPKVRQEAGRRIANALARVRDDLFVDGDFPPPDDEEYRKVFEWAFGVTIEGPELLDAEFEAEMESESAEDVPAAAGGQESAEDVPERPEPIPAPEERYDGLGDQGHIGTAHPDE